MIREAIQFVRRRQQLAAGLRAATWGMAVGVLLAFLLAVLRLTMNNTWPWFPGPVLTGGALVVGFTFGISRRSDDLSAARLLDQHFRLQDRVVTALQFLNSPEAERPLPRMQIEDTQRRLSDLDPAECVPLMLPPQVLRWAGVLAAITVVLLISGTGHAPEVLATPQLPVATNQAKELRETMIRELEQLAEEHANARTSELIQELKERVEQLDRNTSNREDLLATLSEMEQALENARESLQINSTTSTLKAVADSMMPATELQAAAKSIAEQDFGEAGDQLAAVDPSKINDRQRRAVADNLRKLSEQGRATKVLQKTIDDLASALESSDEQQTAESLKQLATACRTQDKKQQTAKALSRQLDRVAQMKAEGRGRGNRPGENTSRSNSSSQQAGRGSDDNPLGDPTSGLNSQRTRERLTGVQTNGESETEIIQSEEGSQQATRQYRQKYNEYRRQAEAVLEKEPLPFSHRQTVRDYFEAIRPPDEPVRP